MFVKERRYVIGEERSQSWAERAVACCRAWSSTAHASSRLPPAAADSGGHAGRCVVDCLRQFLLILMRLVVMVVVFELMTFSPRNFLFHFSFSIILFKCLVHITCSQ